MKIICTLCSREKRNDKELVPASIRYTSARIEKVKKTAEDKKLPLFFLSGKFGLISEYEKIPYYDHLLDPAEILSLSEVVKKQLKENGITEINFISKPNETSDSKPYTDVLETAAKRLKLP
jgi:hypothetical protein